MINGNCLQNAIISGANNIANYKTLVDELNIFPVPDGDTGTNMSMTMMSAKTELSKIGDVGVGKVASLAASALLRGARGNSGVILSLLFRGFSKGLAELEEANGKDIVKALGIGVEAAYGAVMKPTEGTMLTVARVAYEKGKEALLSDNDPIYIWNEICKGANEALKTTPDLLPVLKKAGVVDAGGKGICLIFEGMLSVLKDGKIVSLEDKPKVEEKSEFSDFFKNAAAKFDDDITFTYCTEFIVGKKEDLTEDPTVLRDYLQGIGDCVVVVDDEEIIKVHVHTEDPGKALQKALEYGQLLTVKVENMKEQHRLAAEKESQNKSENKLEPKEPTEEIGFVAVSAGEGLETLFMDLGCNHVVSGGQTMNPSTEDLLEAVMATPAKVVFLLPNNKNIIMAAEQTVTLANDRRVIVLPTRTIPQGLSAMLSFDTDLSVDENKELMLDAASKVSTGSVTFAARNSEYGGFKIKEGDILALNNGKLSFTEKDAVKAVYKLAKSMVNRDTSFLTIIYGSEISEEEAQVARDLINSKLGSNIDITVVNGGQPVYYFMLSVE